MQEDSKNGTFGGTMNQDTIRYALIGLKSWLKSSRIAQEDFADGVTTPQHLSRILNFKAGASEAMIERLAQKAQVNVEDLVLLGTQADKPSGRDSADLRQREYVDDPLDMLDEVAKLFRKERDDKTYWKSCFDALSIPVCIIDHTGVIIYQNQADRSLYRMDMVGREMCPACRENDGIPHPCDDCAIEKAMSIGEPSERLIEVHGASYRIIASPTITATGRHVIVLAIPSEELSKVKRERDILKEQLNFLLKNAQIPVVFGDQYQKINYVSQEFLDLFNIEKHNLNTTAEYWALLVEKLVNPTEAVRVSKSARAELQKGQCNIEFVTGEKGILIAQPAFGESGELIGVLVKIILT